MEIYKLRKALKLTQLELANRIGIRQSNLSVFENGKREPKGSIKNKIAKVMRAEIKNQINKFKQINNQLDVK